MFHANFTHYTESDDQKLGGGDQYTVGPPSQKVEGHLSPTVPMVVAPMQEEVL